MIVCDTNLVAYLLIGGPLTDVAREVLRKDPVWVAPPLWRSEFRNVLSGYLRRKELALPDALDLVRLAEDLLARRERAPSSADVLSIVARSGCSAYDGEFVALAEELSVRLVTSDRPLLRRFPATAIDPRRFLAG
ncbi:MAG: type II toxin-antitoxin system VapC family toxin [Planctomycetes bacterium]|nr:type II toxin-antitoxin system VapC family toxin [Planctomycetota bacterium]